MNKTFKRIFAAVCAGAMAFSLAACAPKEAIDFTDYSGADKVFTEPVELDVIVADHVSWPYNENWAIWKYMQEGSGAALNITAIPGGDFDTKIPLLMANPDALPDLLHTWAKSQVEKYAASGAYLSYTDNMDKMPTMEKFFSTLPEAELNELLMQRTSGDGKVYSAPSHGATTVSNIRSWMYRKDIFDKHGLEVPTTADELYQVAKKLKELYPDSYPLCFRDGLFRIEDWGPAWQNDFTFQQYYDFKTNEWKYGAAESICKEMVEFFLKLKEEGLVPPDYTDMPTKSWEELMTTDRGFITSDYIVRIDVFNNAARPVNPEYTLAVMAPPQGANAAGQRKMLKSNLDLYGFCVCNTGDKDKQNAAFKFVDWLYTDEAAQLLGWGVEGETYEVVDGRKQFILGEGEDPQNKYGFGTYGTYQKADPASYEALYSEEQVAACYEVHPYMEEHINPIAYMGFPTELEQEASDLHAEVFNYVEENLSKFLLGQTPMSEWDVFQQGLKEMGVDRLLEVYGQAYSSVMEAFK